MLAASRKQGVAATAELVLDHDPYYYFGIVVFDVTGTGAYFLAFVLLLARRKYNK